MVTAAQAQFNWRKQKAIMNRIISHPEYRFDSDKKWPLLNLAEFVFSEMAHWNNLYWRIRNAN
jgi:hypothetical protein